MFSKVLLISLFVCFNVTLLAQDTLPNFTVQSLGNDKVRIGWVNPFGQDLVQLNVQRSYDSKKGFRTIFSTPSPELPQNGFVDSKANGSKLYYRIFYMFGSNAYFFSKTISTDAGTASDVLQNLDANKSITIKVKDTVYAVLNFEQFKLFRDSIITKTKDSLFTVGDDAVIVKPYIPSTTWMASIYVFTDRTGNVVVKLPSAKEKKYALIIYDTDNATPLYSIKHFSDSELILNKASFVHAGWFTFELYEEDKLKERNRFYLQREF